jgi:hypothetical protein
MVAATKAFPKFEEPHNLQLVQGAIQGAGSAPSACVFIFLYSGMGISFIVFHKMEKRC